MGVFVEKKDWVLDRAGPGEWCTVKVADISSIRGHVIGNDGTHMRCCGNIARGTVLGLGEREADVAASNCE